MLPPYRFYRKIQRDGKTPTPRRDTDAGSVSGMYTEKLAEFLPESV